MPRVLEHFPIDLRITQNVFGIALRCVNKRICAETHPKKSPLPEGNGLFFKLYL